MWVADHGRLNGVRRRRFFRTREQAEADVETAELQRRSAGDVWVGLTPSERLDAAQVIVEARKRGLTLRAVWDRFLALDAEAPAEVITLGDAIDRFLDAKGGNGTRPKYLESLRYSLRKFAAGREATPLHEVGAPGLSAHIDGLGSQWGKRSAFRRLSTFWSFARRRGWVTANPFERVELVRVGDKVPVVLTVRQAARALVWTRRHRPRALAVLALAMFAGIRPWEIRGVTWADVDLDDGFVRVSAAASKVAQRRIVTLEPAAVAWLRLAKDAGAQLPATAFLARRLLPALAGVLGWSSWPHDALRHTAASYLIAHRRDLASVAVDLGNSPGILLRHYRELVTKRDAARFWGLVPRGYRVFEERRSVK